MPVAVADLRRPARRVDDVGEKHRREDPVVGHLGLVPGEELGDLLKRLTPRFDEVVDVAPRQLDVLRARYVVGDVPAQLGRYDWIVGVVDNESWHADCRKQRSHVQLGQVRQHEGDGPRAAAERSCRAQLARISSFHGMSGFARCANSPVPHMAT